MSPIGGWTRRLHEATMRMQESVVRYDIETMFNETELQAAEARRRVINERAALAVLFQDFRPDGRPTKAATYLAVAQVIGMMGDCSRDHVGAVAVRDDLPLAWGYNGTDPGAPGCLAGACPRATQNAPAGSDYHNCISRHAEVNTISFAAHHGVSLAGATLYVSREPCAGCWKVIKAAKISDVSFPAA